KSQRHSGASGSVMPRVAGVTFLAALLLLLVGLSVMGPLLNRRLPRNTPAVASPAAPAPVNPFGAPPMPPAPGGFGPGLNAGERFRQFHQEIRQFHQEKVKRFSVPPMLPGPREFGPGFNPFDRFDHFLELPQQMHQLAEQGKQEMLTKYGDRALTIT